MTENKQATISTIFKILKDEPRILLNIILLCGIVYVYQDFKTFLNSTNDVLHSISLELKELNIRIDEIEQHIEKSE